MPKVKGEFICMISQSKLVEQTQTVGLIFHFAPPFIRTKGHNQQNRNLQLVNVCHPGLWCVNTDIYNIKLHV